MAVKQIKDRAYFLSEKFVASAAGYPLDKNMLNLVVVLNQIPGVETKCSCGGHDGNAETPKGNFWVSLVIEETARGWNALGLLAELFGVTQFANSKRRVELFPIAVVVRDDEIRDHRGHLIKEKLSDCQKGFRSVLHWQMRGTMKPDTVADRIRQAISR
jgi:hypothetical protein